MPNKKPKKYHDYMLNMRQASESCGVSVNTFKTWGVEPIFTDGKNKYFCIADILEKRVDSIVSDRIKTGEDDQEIDKDQEYARKLQQERIKLELANAVTLREQAPVELLSFALENVVTQMIPVLEGVVLTVKREAPDVPMSILSVVDREIAKARNAMADTQIDFNQMEL
ncbi:MAG: hypothetical protein ACRBHB_18070 [Arenicella sp.]